MVIPVDGVNTANPYEHDYALHQLSVLPAGTNKRIHFTTLEGISFAYELPRPGILSPQAKDLSDV